MANTAKSLVSLVAIAGIAGLLVSWAERVSRDRIEINRAETLRSTLGQVLDANRYDNDLLATRDQVQDLTLLSESGPIDVYFATLANEPTAVLFTPPAADGYNGAIDLLVGIDFDNRITGVRVLEHKETPGLGDGIELNKSPWVLQFDGKTFSDPPRDEWLIRADGGEFEQLTGATVTPRAVVKAVKNTLIYFQENKDRLARMAVREPAGGTP